MLNDSFFALLTSAINSYLSLDPTSGERLKNLNGKNVTIELLPLSFIFQCCFVDNRVVIKPGESLPVDTKITGTPLSMLTMVLTREDRQRFFADDVTITGNAELGQQIILLFDELSIDWEEQLAKLTGDAPAYYLNQFVAKTARWFSRIENSLSRDVNNYIHEEANWIPAAEALQDFYHDVDQLRMDVDRVAAQIKQLELAMLKNEVNK